MILNFLKDTVINKSHWVLILYICYLSYVKGSRICDYKMYINLKHTDPNYHS